MGVYINMEMPHDENDSIHILGDGTAVVYRAESIDIYKAIPVPPHGRLIDADEITEHKYTTIPSHRKEYADGKPKSDEEIIAFKFGWNYAIDAIVENASTIIEAEEG